MRPGVNCFLVALALCLASGSRLPAAESGQESQNPLVWLQFIATELRDLRRELLEDRLERQLARVRALEVELNQARIERSDGVEVQRAQAQELLNLEQQLADPALAAEERTALLALRTEVTARDGADRADFAQKEKQIAERLQSEQTRLESLRAMARALAPKSNAPAKN
jgi:hypothetical protein